MWDTILGIILSLLCGLIGLGGAGLIAYQVLRIVGVPHANGQALRWAVGAFGIPVGIVGLFVGWRLGVTLVYS